jgi:hypothetical protein
MRTMKKKAIFRGLLVAGLVFLAGAVNSQATGLFSSVDAEKPNPQFTKDQDRITAKFIPRAKSTSVSLEFKVLHGGTLDAVKGVDFAAIDRPAVDIKNFKSAAFEIDIRDVAPGGTATVAIRSDFFSISTAFYIFNTRLASPWIKDAQKENNLVAPRVRELIIDVRDGGERDADGVADGRIRLVGGPRDSFWGYALGTLFIRFFGIFFVLSLLMIGMFASGWVFTLIDRLRQGKTVAKDEKITPPVAPAPALEPAPATPSAKPSAIPETVVAAIGAALYLRDTATRIDGTAASSAEPGTAWGLSGRQRIMQERLTVFRQAGRTRN